jgi:hypothetical protein
MKIIKLPASTYTPLQITLETPTEAAVLRAIASDATDVRSTVKSAVREAIKFTESKPTSDEVEGVLKALRSALTLVGIH